MGQPHAVQAAPIDEEADGGGRRHFEERDADSDVLIAGAGAFAAPRVTLLEYFLGTINQSVADPFLADLPI